jgi:hypothetical protein
VLPWAVKAYNEGGYNSTVVCLECLFDAAERLRLLERA